MLLAGVEGVYYYIGWSLLLYWMECTAVVDGMYHYSGRSVLRQLMEFTTSEEGVYYHSEGSHVLIYSALH